MPSFEYNVYENREIECNKCGWKGLGKELTIEEIDESSYIIDLACPNCNEHLGFTQPPMISEK